MPAFWKVIFVLEPNASLEIWFREEGSVILARLWQPEKASLPIVVIPFSSVTLDSFSAPLAKPSGIVSTPAATVREVKFPAFIKV